MSLSLWPVCSSQSVEGNAGCVCPSSRMDEWRCLLLSKQRSRSDKILNVLIFAMDNSNLQRYDKKKKIIFVFPFP